MCPSSQRMTGPSVQLWCATAALLCLSLALAGCGSKAEQAGPTIGEPPAAEAPAAYEPRAVTADIQTGIERHIAEGSAANDGYFPLTFHDKELRLQLVRVHVEYLASLGPDLNFACVDLVDTDGEVYDVDFFMEGPPEDMVVTEATVHKINSTLR